VFMGVAFRELPVGRSQLRLSQSRDRALQGSTHCGYCVHGSHLLPIDHDRRNANRPATRCAIGIATGCRVPVERVGPYTLICEEATPTAGKRPLISERAHRTVRPEVERADISRSVTTDGGNPEP